MVTMLHIPQFLRYSSLLAWWILVINLGASTAFLVIPSTIVNSNVRHSSAYHSSSLANERSRVLSRVSSSTTARYGKLWDRMEIEEDSEPMWYLLNCIATQELDLLRQCRARCGHMEDVVKFVVPIERSTRSHGPNRIVTDTKVAYQGYVFAKLRLCKDVYEAIQELDLCRSWMGTVNKKGYRKLPPAPVALNEDEIEKFGLENLDEDVDFNEDPVADLMNEEGIIIDTEENEVKAKAKRPKIDMEQLEAYKDLRPDDMVKVIGNNKFKGEDGIIKRLKNGKLMVRFFTYGSTYEEWLEPDDVRKLTHEEVLRGLSGPTAPVTQDDLEGGDDPRDQRFEKTGPGGLRKALMSSVNGNRGIRNTRFETTQRGDRYKRDVFGRTDDERKNEERNWSGGQDPQRPRMGQRDRNDSNPRGRGTDARFNPMGDVDSQWGRNSQRDERRDRGTNGDRRFGENNERRPVNDDRPRSPRTNREVERVEKALDGGGDWSAFISPSPVPSSKNANKDDDAFFSSLMSELNGEQGVVKPAASASNDDDFFSSLMAELNNGDEKVLKGENRRQSVEPVANAEFDNFFASLEAELREPSNSRTKGSDTKLASEESKPRLVTNKSTSPDNIKKTAPDNFGDDFFAQLERELSEPGFDGDVGSDKSVSADNDFFAQLEAEISAPKGKRRNNDNDEQVPRQTSHPSKSGNVLVGLDGDSLAKSTVPKLKEMLKERGLKVSGNKAELIERLLS